MSFQKVILCGNLGADPESRFTSTGRAVTNFRMATTERWNDDQGNKQERTEWHRIVAWGRLAEICGEYLNKGRMCLVEGRLQTRQWTDKENNKRYTTEIVAQQVKLLGGRPQGQKNDQQGNESMAPSDVADIPVADLDDPDYSQEAEDYLKG
jgi:single-strand DNA-binding protein